MPGRFGVNSYEQPNHMEVVVAGQMQQLEKQLEQLHATLRQLEKARVYLNDVRFKQGAL
jgi:adenylylsulfate kinase-like enzyme